MDVSLTTEVMAISVIFWPLGQNLVAVATPLSPFVPKLVAMVMPLCPVYGSVTDEFPDGTYTISKPNSAWMCRLQLKLWPFL